MLCLRNMSLCVCGFLLCLSLGCGGAAQQATPPAGSGSADETAMTAGEMDQTEAAVATEPDLMLASGTAADASDTRSGQGNELADPADSPIATSTEAETKTEADAETEADTPAVVDHDLWIADFEMAKAKAASEDKDILMDFTGSDWCGWCIRLHDEVFQYQTFADYAEENFVLLELDYPRDKSILTPEIQAQNAELQQRYPIQGFPTILLADAAGRPYAATGYQQGGPEAYVAHLEDQKKMKAARDAAFAATESVEGVERARKIDTALSLVPQEYVLLYEDEVAELIELDKDNEAGLRDQYQERVLHSRFSSAMDAIQRQVQSAEDAPSALTRLDEMDKEFSGHGHFKVPLTRVRLQLLQLTDQKEEAVAVIDRFVQELPQDPMTLQFMITKAAFLAELDRREEAAATIEQVRELADPSRHERIDEIKRELLGEEEESPEAPQESTADPE